MTPVQLLQAKSGVTPDGNFGPNSIKAAAKFFKLTNEQAAHFFGQCCHETGGFKLFEENLNYSAEGLLKTFPKYFKTEEIAKQYARNPMKIANRVYANRMGNGDEASGDGWKYRGRGAIQLTGKSNYTLFAKEPDTVATELAFESALFFFNQNKLWSLTNTVDNNSILALTKKVNGGTIGLDDRILLTNKFYKEIKNGT